MRAAVLERPRRFNVVDLAPPDAGPEEVRVRLQGCGDDRVDPMRRELDDRGLVVGGRP